MSPEHVLLIEQERQRQVELGYDSAHDDGQSARQWEADIACYAALIVEPGDNGDWKTLKQRLVQVAALAVAALESAERQEKVCSV